MLNCNLSQFLYTYYRGTRNVIMIIHWLFCDVLTENCLSAVWAGKPQTVSVFYHLIFIDVLGNLIWLSLVNKPLVFYMFKEKGSYNYFIQNLSTTIKTKFINLSTQLNLLYNYVSCSQWLIMWSHTIMRIKSYFNDDHFSSASEFFWRHLYQIYWCHNSLHNFICNVGLELTSFYLLQRNYVITSVRMVKLRASMSRQIQTREGRGASPSLCSRRQTPLIRSWPPATTPSTTKKLTPKRRKRGMGKYSWEASAAKSQMTRSKISSVILGQ